jgi:hypothetical protein
MSSLGWHAGFPLPLGGDLSPSEKAFSFLLSALGQSSVAVVDGGIEMLRLECIAIGMSCIAEFDERAVLQAFPNLAIDSIPVFERLLGISPAPGALEQERREEITRKFVELISSEIPNLTTRLQEIDQRLSVLNVPWEESIVVEPGRAFQGYRFNDDDTDETFDFNLGPDGVRSWTEFPMYSSHDTLIVLFDLGSGVAPTRDDRKTIEIVKSLLADALPSFNNFQIITEIGFIAGTSLTGYAGV